MVRLRPAVVLGIVAVAVLGAVTMLAVVGFLLGWTYQPIETRSMEPAYRAGSLAVVIPVDAADVEQGMTIVFEDPRTRDRLVAHRVVRQLPGDALAWETKGDANATSDPLPVHASSLRGRVAWTIPAVGSLVSALRGPQALLLLVVLPVTVLIWTEIREWRRRRPKAPPGPVPQ